jgi:formylglycine-generating enzyme required for sulfatase activity
MWLADTPVTQALWEAVMGDNPSDFRSPNRPVETVSWNDCQVFLKRLNELVPGLAARLPSEAEWEYACRAGTETATWLGDLEIWGEYNAPLLDSIAWYGGNSGVDFELERGGRDSREWPNKQYNHTWAGTRPVSTRAPNPLGLYDMLGNVFEWCTDAYGKYRADDLVNPPAYNLTGGWSRVFRGGSWLSYARYIRAAGRYACPPEDRVASLGFRLARGPAPGQAAEPETWSGPVLRDAGRGEHQ